MASWHHDIGCEWEDVEVLVFDWVRGSLRCLARRISLACCVFGLGSLVVDFCRVLFCHVSCSFLPFFASFRFLILPFSVFRCFCFCFFVFVVFVLFIVLFSLLVFFLFSPGIYSHFLLFWFFVSVFVLFISRFSSLVISFPLWKEAMTTVLRRSRFVD